MQTVTPEFQTASEAKVRKPTSSLEVSWTKNLDPGYTFFTIGVSEIGGTDIIKGIGAVPEEFEYYDFADESSYVESIEIDRYFEQPVSSVVRAALDVVLNNTSGRFSPDGASPIAGDIKPNRPIKVRLGFEFGSIETVVNFRGQIAEFPKINTSDKTVAIFALDMMDIIADQVVETSVLLQDMRVDEIIAYLLEEAGITSDQYDFEPGAVIIPFASYEKGAKLGNIIKNLVQAEGGVFWVDETGIFRFISRDSWNSSPYNSSVIDLTDDLVVSEASPDTNSIINAVEVIAKPRALQPTQPIYSQKDARQIQPGESVEIWATFTDPSTNILAPQREVLLGSSFKGGMAADDFSGNGSEYLNVTSFSTFSTSAKVTIENNHPDLPIYLTELFIYGQPAKITKELYVRAEDEDSIADFGERLLRIENNYIQTESWAYALAKTIVEDRKDLNSFKRLVVRGLPQLELGDMVTRNGETYNIVRIVTKFDGANGLTQDLTLHKKTIQTYFRIGISTIGGTDMIAP